MRSRCGGCGRFSREGHRCLPVRTVTHDPYVPVEDALAAARSLVRRYGSVVQAGYAYAERHGLTPEAGARTLSRILNGHVGAVRETTLDRLSVMV